MCFRKGNLNSIQTQREFKVKLNSMKVDQIPSTWQMQNIFKDLTRTEGRQTSKLVFTDQSNEPQTEHRAGCEILW